MDIVNEMLKSREIRTCGITYNNFDSIQCTTIGGIIPRNGDFLEAIFFIFPEKFYDNIKFANIQTTINLDLVEKENIKIINRIDGMIVVQPLFFGNLSIKYPISLHVFQDGPKVGLTFNTDLQRYDMRESEFKIGLLYQNFKNPIEKDEYHMEDFSLKIKRYGEENFLIFKSGFSGIKYLTDSPHNTISIHGPSNVNLLNTKSFTDNINEFDKYISKYITDEIIDHNPINKNGVNIKSARR